MQLTEQMQAETKHYRRTSRPTAASMAIFALALIAAALLVSVIGVDITLANGRIVSLSRPWVEGQSARNEIVPIGNALQQTPAADAEQRLLDRLDAGIAELRENLPELLQKADAAGDGHATEEGWDTIRMRVTAYCPCRICCGKNSDGMTANMHRICPGDRFVAADKMFGFHTEMVIPGYGGGRPVEVKDRGRLIKGYRLDVFFNSHEEAKEWGVRYLDVKVKRS